MTDQPGALSGKAGEEKQAADWTRKCSLRGGRELGPTSAGQGERRSQKPPESGKEAFLKARRVQGWKPLVPRRRHECGPRGSHSLRKGCSPLQRDQGDTRNPAIGRGLLQRQKLLPTQRLPIGHPSPIPTPRSCSFPSPDPPLHRSKPQPTFQAPVSRTPLRQRSLCTPTQLTVLITFIV